MNNDLLRKKLKKKDIWKKKKCGSSVPQKRTLKSYDILFPSIMNFKEIYGWDNYFYLSDLDKYSEGPTY